LNLEYYLQFATLIVLLSLSIICIRQPMRVALIIVEWAKLVSGKNVRSSEARNAIDLMEKNPNEYERKYVQQLSIIRLSGWVGLFVAVVGSCILTMSK
jgi:hypothetical protein